MRLVGSAITAEGASASLFPNSEGRVLFVEGRGSGSGDHGYIAAAMSRSMVDVPAHGTQLVTHAVA